MRWPRRASPRLARTHSRDADDVAKVCDSFDGVVIPYAEDVELIKRLAAAAVYRPLKGVALERVIKEGKWPSDKTRDYIEQKCADTLFVPMIESVRALENLDAICAIPGVSALFIGPNDMTTNMGIPNEYDHPDFIAVVQKVIDAADKRHIPAGSHGLAKPSSNSAPSSKERASSATPMTAAC
jgi:2-keto-3-deoxy-L-rhamnonate aldolase RhmA